MIRGNKWKLHLAFQFFECEKHFLGILSSFSFLVLFENFQRPPYDTSCDEALFLSRVRMAAYDCRQIYAFLLLLLFNT